MNTQITKTLKQDYYGYKQKDLICTINKHNCNTYLKRKLKPLNIDHTLIKQTAKTMNEKQQMHVFIDKK